MKSKTSILLLLLLPTLTTFGQFISPSIWKSPTNRDSSTFYLYYGFAGLGSNLGNSEPTIRIKGTNFIYTYEQNSYFVERSKKIDTVCIMPFRQSSIDSIIEIIKDLKDTSIRETNFCIMSGGIHFISIINGADTTNFELSNTFHYTALKIANILNEYAPKDKQLWADEKMIKDAEDCWTALMKRVDDDKKKKRKSTKNKNGL